MKKLILPAILIVLMALAGCGKGGPVTSPGGGGGANEVDMASVTFVQSSITVKAGTAIKFNDPTATGALHILCFGHDQICKANAQGPTDLNASAGVTFNPGDSKSYTFATAGTYEVTCTVHPNMDVTITVQ
jgi:plastocyanin